VKPKREPQLARFHRVEVDVLDAFVRFAGQARAVEVADVGIAGVEQVEQVERDAAAAEAVIGAEIDEGGGLRTDAVVLDQRRRSK
jgi:hypothetical protein